jgi:hypothetical protein
MKSIVSFFAVLYISLFSYSEVMWVGDPNFEARGCSGFGAAKLEEINFFPKCNMTNYCQGKVSCYFIHKDKLRNVSDWRTIMSKYPPGIDTWIKADSGVLCSAAVNDKCDTVNIDNCANMPGSAMNCTMKTIVSPSLQVIPKEEGNVK